MDQFPRRHCLESDRGLLARCWLPCNQFHQRDLQQLFGEVFVNRVERTVGIDHIIGSDEPAVAETHCILFEVGAFNFFFPDEDCSKAVETVGKQLYHIGVTGQYFLKE